MRYLFDAWDNLKENLKNKVIILFLDFDGTLTPIVDTPNMAKLSLEARSILNNIVSRENYKLSIISGRLLSDIKEKIGIKGIVYIGNHGLEMEGPKIKFENRIPIETKKVVRELKTTLFKKFSNIKGVLIEDKNLSFSVHYRLVDRGDLDYIKSVFNEISRDYLLDNKINLLYGKEVIEVRPKTAWNKGKIVLWLLARFRFIIEDKDIEPIYIGDDVTDEDAFEVLKNKEFTIFVGRPKESFARYYLNDPDEVIDFLNLLIKCPN